MQVYYIIKICIEYLVIYTPISLAVIFKAPLSRLLSFFSNKI